MWQMLRVRKNCLFLVCLSPMRVLHQCRQWSADTYVSVCVVCVLNVLVHTVFKQLCQCIAHNACYSYKTNKTAERKNLIINLFWMKYSALFLTKIKSCTMGVCTHAYSLGNINTRICCHSCFIKDFHGKNYFELPWHISVEVKVWAADADFPWLAIKWV